MRDSIAVHYINQLNKKSLHDENATNQGKINQLKIELENIADLPSLRERLSAYIPLLDKYTVSCCFFFNYSPLKFLGSLSSAPKQANCVDTLKTWDHDLKQIEELEITVRQKLTAIKKTGEKQTELVTFMFQILDKPQSLIHLRTLSLLKRLNDSQLEKTLDYLANLQDAPIPEKTERGSFASIETVTVEQAVCKSLLYNNSVNYDDKNSLQVYANGLLQDCLIIFKDVTSEFDLRRDDRLGMGLHNE